MSKLRMCFNSIDTRLRNLNWVKQKEDYYGAIYLRYEYDGKYLHRLDIVHKSKGDSLIQSYQQGVNSDGFNNCVGLSYQDTKLALKKYRQLRRRYRWK